MALLVKKGKNDLVRVIERGREPGDFDVQLSVVGRSSARSMWMGPRSDRMFEHRGERVYIMRLTPRVKAALRKALR